MKYAISAPEFADSIDIRSDSDRRASCGGASRRARMVNATAKTPSVKTVSRSLRAPSLRREAIPRAIPSRSEAMAVSISRSMTPTEGGRNRLDATQQRSTMSSTSPSRSCSHPISPATMAAIMISRKDPGMTMSWTLMFRTRSRSRSGMVRPWRTAYSQMPQSIVPMQNMSPAKKVRLTGDPIP